MDAVERSCTVTASNKSYNVILKVNFPANYPNSAQPTFQFCPGTTIDNATMTKLLKVLKQTAQQRVKKNRSIVPGAVSQAIDHDFGASKRNSSVCSGINLKQC